VSTHKKVTGSGMSTRDMLFCLLSFAEGQFALMRYLAHALDSFLSGWAPLSREHNHHLFKELGISTAVFIVLCEYTI
jgi:hypothetical protein